MPRSLVLALPIFALSAVAFFASVAQVAAQGITSGLVSEETALRHGLVRAWWLQAEMDQTRDRISHVQLFGDTLYVQTELSVVQAIDAETGNVRWVRQVGERGHFSHPLAATDDYVALVNGGNLFMVDAQTGKARWDIRLPGAPISGAGLSRERVYVPLVKGLIYSWQLRDHTGSRPWTHDAHGRVYGQMLTSPRGVSWGTKRGYVYLNEARTTDDWFMKQLSGGTSTKITYRAPHFFVGTDDGYVYAIEENSEDELDIFTHSSPIVRPVVAIDKFAYVFPLNSGMFKTSIETGVEQWWVPQARDFIACSAKHVYVADRLGRTLIIDKKTGGLIETLPTERMSLKMANYSTDRLYVGTEQGLIQCLYEIGQKEPLRYDLKTDKKEEAKPDVKPDEKEPFDPFAKGPKGEDPFKVKEKEGDKGDDDKDMDEDPFGGGGDPFKAGGGEDPFKAGGAEDPFKANAADDPFKQ